MCISFPTRIRLGTKHRMYTCVRTYGYKDTMRVRLVVEKKNERNTTVIGCIRQSSRVAFVRSCSYSLIPRYLHSTKVPTYRSLRVHTYLRVYVQTVVLSLLPLVTTACYITTCSNHHVPTYLVHLVYLPTTA
jgi:peroxiredoxin